MIYQLLSGIYHRLSSFPPVEKMGDMYLQGFPWDIREARKRLLRQLKERDTAHDVIRILFLLQDPYNWSVMRPVYEEARKDPAFNVGLIAVPDEIAHNGDRAYRMLKELYGEDAVRRADTEEGWLDIRSLQPDYVFLPQDHYFLLLPHQYDPFFDEIFLWHHDRSFPSNYYLIFHYQNPN